MRNFCTKFSLDLKQYLCITCCSGKRFDEEKKTFKKLYCFILFRLDSKVHIIGFLSIEETAWRWFLIFMTADSRSFHWNNVVKYILLLNEVKGTVYDIMVYFLKNVGIKMKLVTIVLLLWNYTWNRSCCFPFGLFWDFFILNKCSVEYGSIQKIYNLLDYTYLSLS